MTLCAVLAAQGNLKGQGMARRPMPCPFQFSCIRQDGACFQFPPPVLVRMPADLHGEPGVMNRNAAPVWVRHFFVLVVDWLERRSPIPDLAQLKE